MGTENSQEMTCVIIKDEVARSRRII